MSTMRKTERRDEKWTQPGWRIEQKYANKVLIGNWLEERLQFTRESNTAVANTTYRLDYRPQWDSKPDAFVRRAAQRRTEGPPSYLFFTHHGIPASHYLVSLYDESYGRKHNSALPARRSWNQHSCAWQPERSDHPITAPPTNFGPSESAKHRVERLPPRLPSLSVYRSAYQWRPLSASCQSRQAKAPRSLSSHLHAANHGNKDLDLRQRSMLQVPDHRSALLPASPRT